MVKKSLIKKIKTLPSGTVRFKTKDLLAYEWKNKSWAKTKKRFPEAEMVIKLFQAHKRLNLLIDPKNPEFLKGMLFPGKNIGGGRIDLLPDGKKIDKAFSLFSENLQIHDQQSGDHWDVIYRNKGGTFSYCYDLEKIRKHRQKKYSKVWRFDKLYPKLMQKVEKSLADKNDYFAVPMYTLLKTYMRVGNEIYYKLHGHKGLTTLKKKDIAIKSRTISFNYIAKDGVPNLVEQDFPEKYVQRLKEVLKKKKDADFVFTAPDSSHPLQEAHFKKAFKNYIGEEFYPHIVRSHYATKQVSEFLKKKRKISKQEAQKFFLQIASKLGHKKFVKKDNAWKESYSVTLSHYVQPELVDKIKSLIT